MAIAIGATLFDERVVTYWWIILGALIGGVGGAIGAQRVKMTAMPQMVALFNGFGGGAAALVALADYHETVGARRATSRRRSSSRSSSRRSSGRSASPGR